jgi:hypothetical protein
MSQQRICPFYGRNLEQCDIGYGYISPFHVEVMVRHCMSHFESCQKYRTLTAEQPDGGRLPDEVGLSGGSVFPLRLEREVVSAVQHVIRTPLTSIRSSAEILLNYPIEDAEVRQRFLQIIQDEAERLSHTVDRMFGKPEVESSTGKPRVEQSSAKVMEEEALEI